MKRVFLFLSIVALCCSCGNTGRTLTSATGSIYEMVVVIDDSLWTSAIGDEIRAVVAADMVGLPQMEATFTISQINRGEFDQFFMPSRNILFVDVNANKYTQTKVYYGRDQYSTPQAYCRIQTPSKEDLEQFWEEQGSQVGQFFVRQELERQGKFYRGFCNHDAKDAVEKRFGSEMYIPNDYMLVKDSTDFVWAVNNSGPARRDIMIWSYPYTDKNTLTKEYLLHKRDSVMKSNVSGQLPNSYTGTEYREMPPVFTPISVQKDGYAAEIRGLWRMFGGEAMGGPFVQHTRIDETNNRVITAEVFVFAPGQSKRNILRQAEAILYTWKLPQERNVLPEVTVASEK